MTWQTGLIAGIGLAVFLSASFGNLSELFTKDAQVLQIVKSGILVSPYTDLLIAIFIFNALNSRLMLFQFVSASQPINALAFIFDGLHYGVSDFSYAAFAMVCCIF